MISVIMRVVLYGTYSVSFYDNFVVRIVLHTAMLLVVLFSNNAYCYDYQCKYFDC